MLDLYYTAENARCEALDVYLVPIQSIYGAIEFLSIDGKRGSHLSCWISSAITSLSVMLFGQCFLYDKQTQGVGIIFNILFLM